jgi:ornithine cyclodeaminase/alanine dehydrogenase-like protein (mu-crystallin family)
VGAGSVGVGSLLTCAAEFAWREARVWSRSQDSLDRFLAEVRPHLPDLQITASTDLERVVRGADVVVTGTHAREPLIRDEWVAPGTHLAALGADLEGEQELDPRILQRARVFVDDIRQCRTDGEINVPLREGLIEESDLAGEIGKVIVGELEGRQSEEQVTVFDSTGIALQDSATVPLEYERAVASGVGIEKKMIST